MTAPTDGPSYQDLLANIAQLSNEELAGLETQIAAAFQAADEADDMDGMTAAADAKDQVEAEAQKRGVTLNDPDMDGDNDESTSPTDNPDAALDIAASADAPAPTATEPAPEGDEPAPAEPAEGETPEGGEPAAEPDTDTPDVDNPAEATAEADNEEEAKVDTPSVPEDRQPQPVPVAASNVVVAAADVADVSAGQPFTDRNQFVQAMVDKIGALRDAEGRGEHARVASVKAPEMDDSRTLLAGDTARNQEKIAEALGRNPGETQALIASGGYCAPLESRYDVFGVGSTDRPLKGALPGFRAQRGGIRWITPPSLAGVTGSVGVWTAATDATPGGATKNKLIVACGAEQTVSISAITLEMQFGNFVARAYPEMVARNTDLGMIAQARLAEQTLFAGMNTLSTAVTSAVKLGIARDFLVAMARAAAAYRTRHRMDPDARLSAVVPAWVRDAMREDVAWSASPTTDNVLAETDQQIQSWISERNIDVAWYMDDASFAAVQGTGAIADFPTSFVWELFAPGTFLFLDGGTLDIGVVRDSTLVGTNDYIQFTENFEAVAKVGLEALKITSTTSVKGAVAQSVATP
jgi:hypothetical protein